MAPSVLELCKCPFHLPPLRIFLEPPSIEELERRLRGRGEKGDDLANRLARGKKELAWIAAEGRDRFDHVLMNDDLGRTLANRQSTFLYLYLQ